MASFILLVYLWVERGRVPGLISALMVLPVVWGNVTRGIAETDRPAFGARPGLRLRAGQDPGAVYIPSVLSLLRQRLPHRPGPGLEGGGGRRGALLAQSAIGTQIYNTKYYLETPSLFAWTLVVIALSFLLEWAVGGLLRRAEGP